MAKKAKTVAAQDAPVVEQAPAARMVRWNPDATQWRKVKANAVDNPKSNRGAWLRRARELDGVTVADWVAYMDEDLPATPTARATKTTYTGQMWLTWMVAERIVTITA